MAAIDDVENSSRLGCGQEVINLDTSPTAVEVESQDIAAVGREGNLVVIIIVGIDDGPQDLDSWSISRLASY